MCRVWCAAVQVPLYDTLGVEAVAFILEQCQMQTVMVARSEVHIVREPIAV